MGKISVYLQDELQKELDAERDERGFKDRAPIVQEALSHWLEKHRGRKIKSRSQVRKRLKTLVADLVIPKLSKKNIQAFRKEKPHNPNGYKHYVQLSENPPEVKERLNEAIDEAFESTREEALEIVDESRDKPTLEELRAKMNRLRAKQKAEKPEPVVTKKRKKRKKETGCSFCGANRKYVSLSQGTYTCRKCGTKWSVVG